MTRNEFIPIVVSLCVRVNRLLLEEKRERYDVSEDVLRNLKRGAEIIRMTPEGYATTLWVKHVTTLLDFIEEKQFSRIDEELLGDVMGYIPLISALLEERRKPEHATEMLQKGKCCKKDIVHNTGKASKHTRKSK